MTRSLSALPITLTDDSDIASAPMIGESVAGYHWIVVGVCTAVGLVLTLLAMRTWRFRVSYWV